VSFHSELQRSKVPAHSFTTTHWSVVLAAGRKESPQDLIALNRLCQTYWYPVYAFVRRMGHSAVDAEDYTQAFFARCLEKNYWSLANQSKGRFRTFLLLALKRFMANEWDRARAQKRGGSELTVSLDGVSAEERYELEPRDNASPDTLFERRWALTLLDNVLTRLEQEQIEAGRQETFQELKIFLAGRVQSLPHEEVASRLGMSEGAMRLAIHRLRQRYRELLCQEIAQTVTSPGDIEQERRYLLAVLSR
jgi:RNA polymerase sigma factor (sigma-70 family)